MTVQTGDFQSVLSGGVGHSGGQKPSFIEVLTRGYWATFEEITAVGNGNYHIAIEIDVSDSTTDTDASVGLYTGFFRWVTGSPNFDGTTNIPTGENGGDIWKQGFLPSKSQISSPNRIINISKGGDYASLSGFNLAVINKATGKPLSKYLEDEGYYLINRPFKVYVVLDGVFKQVWGGIVSKTKYTETVFEIIGKDVFQHRHKSLPPRSLNVDQFPNVDPDSIGDAIPVVLGDVDKSPLLPIINKNPPLEVSTSIDGEKLVFAIARGYNLSNISIPELTIWTPRTRLSESDFVGKHLRVIRGTPQVVPIIDARRNFTPVPLDPEDNDVEFWELDLGSPLRDSNGVVLNTSAIDFVSGDIRGGDIADELFIFEVIDLSVPRITSNLPIHSYRDNGLSGPLSVYNEDLNEFKGASDLQTEVTTFNSNNIGFPNVSVVSEEISTEDREYRLLTDLEFELISATWNGTPVDFPQFLTDKSRVTAVGGNTTPASGFFTDTTKLVVDLSIPTDIGRVVDDIFFGFDLTINEEFTLPPPLTPGQFEATDGISVRSTIFVLNPYRTVGTTPESEFKMGELNTVLLSLSREKYKDFSGNGPTVYNTLPNDYYTGGLGNQQDSVSDQILESVSLIVPRIGTVVGGNPRTPIYSDDVLKIPNDVFDKQLSFVKNIQFRLVLELPAYVDASVKQVGLYGRKNLDATGDVYAKIKGENFGAEQTNNVYNAIRHILETYDGFQSSEVDYKNTQSNREDWRLGRHISQSARSSKYLKELCDQSFLGMYPDRLGKRAINAFLNQTTPIQHFHDNQTILQGSIKKTDTTTSENLFNEFEINYDYNHATKKYNKQIFIKNADKTSFPVEHKSTGLDSIRNYNSLTVRETGSTFEVDVVVPIAELWASLAVGKFFSVIGTTGASFLFGECVRQSETATTRTIIIAVDSGLTDGTSVTSGVITEHGTSISEWRTFVGGIISYSTAQTLWNRCRSSYLKTLTLNPFKKNLDFYIDEQKFDEVSDSDSHSAFKYVEILIKWIAEQKQVFNYSVPITSQSLELDLLDLVEFKDVIYTNNEVQRGYLTKIKDDLKGRKRDLEITMEPLGFNP